LAESWDGTSWSQMPGFESSINAQLLGVSCVSTTFCVAIGEAILGSGFNEEFEPFVEDWNGTIWLPMYNPVSPAKGASLDAVSCASARFCVTVGTAEQVSSTGDISEEPFIESYNGRRWRVVSSPTSSQELASLTGVSCAENFCMAVGAEGNLNANPPTVGALTENFEDGSWSVVPDPGSSSPFSYLFDVSCTSNTSCTTIGLGGAGALVESWNGSKWNGNARVGSLAASFSGISCTSYADAYSCTAVGTVVPGESLSERMTQSAGASSAAYGLLKDMVCREPARIPVCSFNSPKVARLDKTIVAQTRGPDDWSIEASPNVTGMNSVLTSVSCVEMAASPGCTAVGAAESPFTSSSITVSSLIESNSS